MKLVYKGSEKLVNNKGEPVNGDDKFVLYDWWDDFNPIFSPSDLELLHEITGKALKEREEFIKGKKPQ